MVFPGDVAESKVDLVGLPLPSSTDFLGLFSTSGEARNSGIGTALNTAWVLRASTIFST